MRSIVSLLICVVCHSDRNGAGPRFSSDRQTNHLRADMNHKLHLQPLGDTQQLALLGSTFVKRTPVRALASLLLGLDQTAALVLSSVPNFRDLGHMRCSDGVIRPYTLLRSATPANITTEEMELSRVRTVLDLRLEKDAMQDDGPRRLAPITKHISLLSEPKMKKALFKQSVSEGRVGLLSKLIALKFLQKTSPSRRLRKRLSHSYDKRLARMLNRVSLADVYEFMLQQSSEELLKAFEIVASEAETPLLVHCTHGKDRTGVLVALLLVACGVSEDDILNDYVISHTWGCSDEGRAAMRKYFPANVVPYLRSDLIDEWCEAPEEQLRELFRRTERKFGSMIGYLDSIGIDEHFRKRIAARLTAPTR